MSPYKKIAVGVAALAALVFAAPAQAADEPGKLTVRLTVTELKNSNDCRVLTVGKVGMTHAQAQYLVDNGATARVEIWGEDAVYDNRMYKGPKATLSAISDKNGGGLFIVSDLTLFCAKYLDEDDIPVYDTGDEVYTKIIFEAPGYPKMTKSSNVVHGSYGLFGT
uniref:hypothetical protein n=1 Tax=Herbidospora sakaeratensis TaxID=564415 RepID=UPI0007809218|nr:hypothetical protein [Herbidospora sakaeratensis]